MNVWANAVITEKGLALLSKLTQGNTLDIVDAVTGAGYVTPGLLYKQTEVTNPKTSLKARAVSYPEEGKCAIPLTMTNDGLETGYEATQVGVFADDPDEGKILFFIAQSITADNGTTVPSETEMPGYCAEWTFTLQYGQADGVNVTVSPANTVNRTEVQTMIDVAIAEFDSSLSEKSVNYAREAGTAGKVKNSLIIKFNGGSTEGTNKWTFDGSTGRSVNITPEKIGAQTAGGTVKSGNADYAEVGEWTDGNPDSEDRIGYFVCIDLDNPGIIMKKASSNDDVRGVTVAAPAFAGNCSDDKFDSDGNLLPQYSFVAVMGIVPVIDNGTCTVGGRCMPASDSTATPVSGEHGYQVMDRVDDTHVLVAVEPGADSHYKMQNYIDSRKKSVVVELPASGWQDGYQTVNVSGVTSGNTILVGYNPDSYEAYSDAGVRCVEQDNGTLTFFCESTPDVDVSANVVILN